MGFECPRGARTPKRPLTSFLSVDVLLGRGLLRRRVDDGRRDGDGDGDGDGDTPRGGRPRTPPAYDDVDRVPLPPGRRRRRATAASTSSLAPPPP